MNKAKQRVILASMIGFLVPILWGCLEFFFFNAHESLLSKMLLTTAHVTCPPWWLPGFWGDIGSPFLNAALYGAITYVVYFRRRSEQKTQSRRD
jgi:hypothetical protein